MHNVKRLRELIAQSQLEEKVAEIYFFLSALAHVEMFN